MLHFSSVCSFSHMLLFLISVKKLRQISPISHLFDWTEWQQLIASTCDQVSECMCNGLSHGILLPISTLRWIYAFINAGPQQARFSTSGLLWVLWVPFRPFNLLLLFFDCLKVATHIFVLLKKRKWSWCCCGEGHQRGLDVTHEQAEGRTWSIARICHLIAPLGRL